MRELRALREGWETVEVNATRLLRRLTTQESIRQWLVLQRSFEAQLQQTATLFRPERRAALAQLQARLRRMAEWQEQHGESAPVHRSASATPE
ncbi:MAG TPA: hypothetical protein VIK33_08955 [Anaerolineae bacterium]